MRDLIALLEDAGFADAKLVAHTGIVTSRYTVGAAFRAHKPAAARH